MAATDVGSRREPARLAERATAAVAQRPHVPALVGVLALSAYLNLARLAQNGDANTYYSAAVRSMLRSVRNFVFVSFDAGGLQSVDKPPLALWVQAASARLFGFSSASLLLPEALAGILAVLVLYLAVARAGGRSAGVVAALALAVSPVAVAVNRDNNPDALLALLLVAAAYAGIRAVQEGRGRWLVASGVLVGLAFETKMALALIVVPGIALAYALLAPRSPRARLAHLGGALVALLVVGGAWIAAVALTPAADRPWISGTSDNSALGLLLEYNGLGRLTGQQGGTSNGGGFGILSGGDPGLHRLVTGSMGDQGGWLLPLALVGGGIAFVLALRARDRARLAGVVVLAGWLLAGGAVLSVASGIVHAYYVAAIAPPIAALVGLGAARTVEAAVARAGGVLVAAAVGIVLTAWLQLRLVQGDGYLTWLVAPIAGAAVGGCVLLAVARGRQGLARAAVGLALAGLVLAPAAWARTTLFAPVSGVSPGAGPLAISGLGSGTAQRGPGGPGGGAFQGGGGIGAPPAGGGPGGGAGGIFGSTQGVEAALAYAWAHGATARFPLIVQSQQGVAVSVISGSRVAALGGFSGRESAMSASAIADLVARGDARFFLLSAIGGLGGNDSRGTSPATTAIAAVCRAVSTTSGGTLYDCAGTAAQLRAAG